MRIINYGANGRLGKEISNLIAKGYKGASLAAEIDRNNTTSEETHQYRELNDFKGEADCIIDFSNHAMTEDLTSYAVKRNIPLVIATTGQNEEEREMIREASKKIPVFFAANMSLGIAVLKEVVKTAVSMMSEDAQIGIIEKHHDKKYDAPSGTAIFLANQIKEVRDEEEIEIHSIRIGNLVGEHEINIGTSSETITLSHRAHSKVLFAEGALRAAEFLIDKPAGLYNMDDIINNH